jgi:2-amino-4-hydroxy-6-hydroxymethyldihydropteridine diphosphokinase/dihydroneopterin aldolase
VLRGLRARGNHGVYAEERAAGQTFLVDLVLHVDTRVAARSDDVADTVHYGELAAEVVAVVVGEPVNLIETLAARIAELCLRRPLIETVEVTVHKPEAPVGVPFEDIAVMIERSRMKVRRAVLSLGSNLGDRLAMLQGGVQALSEAGQIVAVSPVYETDPVGGPEQADFFNAVVVVETDLDAHTLLEIAQAAEVRAARVRNQRWGPRTLDVDIIALGDEVVDDADLAVPHPRAGERAFVLVPWSAVDGDATFPDGRRVADLVAGLDLRGVRLRADLALALPAVGRA